MSSKKRVGLLQNNAPSLNKAQVLSLADLNSRAEKKGIFEARTRFASFLTTVREP